MYSADLLILFFFIFIYFQLNKRLRFPQRFFTGLTIYLPPLDEDYEILCESAKRPRTNRKGEAPKAARISRHPKLKIPLRSAKLEPGINQNVTGFMFQDFEFLFMVWCAGVIIPIVSLILKTLFSSYEYVNSSNLAFNFSTFCLIGLSFKGFMHTYNANSNECKLSLFVLVKTFFFSFIFFSYFSEMFSTQLSDALSQSIPRINQLFSTILDTDFAVKKWQLVLSLSICCCLLSFLIARAGVKYGYYFYLFLYAETEEYLKEEGEKENKKRKQSTSFVRVLSIIVFLLPFAISVTYIHDIFTDPLVKAKFSPLLLDLFRLLLVWLFCALKIIHMRLELQLYFDQTVAYFQALVSQDVQESKFKFVQNTIRLTIHRIWLLGCQYLYTFGIPSILAVLQTYNLFWNCTQNSNYDFSKAQGDLTMKVKEAMQKPLLLCEGNYAWISTFTFWFFLSLSGVSAFALFYYRRYKESVSNQ